jgi:hypothetical protein
MSSPTPAAAWATVDDLPAAVAYLHAPARWSTFLETSTAVLWALSGRRWRGSSTQVTATLRAVPPRGQGWLWHRSWGTCSCTFGSLHTEPARIRLPHPDVTAVSSVTIDGQGFAAWELDGAWLSRVDGSGWPMCGSRTVVVYDHGLEPPAAGKAACVELAVELGRAASDDPDQPCQLPRRLTSVSRQGLSFEQAPELDRMEFLDKGRTGIYSIDLFLAAVNPKGRAQAARVWSPDLGIARRT